MCAAPVWGNGYALLFRFLKMLLMQPDNPTRDLPIDDGCRVSDGGGAPDVVILACFYFALAVTRSFVRPLP